MGAVGGSEPRDNLIQPLGWANGETTDLVRPEVSWGPHRASVRTGDKPPDPSLGGPGIWRLLVTQQWPMPHQAPGQGQGFPVSRYWHPQGRGLWLQKAGVA